MVLIVRNNVISSTFAGSREHDVPVSIERGVNTLVAHNTIFNETEAAYANSIEIRWSVTSDVTVHGNLSSGAISLRDDAVATLTDNVTDAQRSNFKLASEGDFQLASCDEVSVAAVHAQVSDDFTGSERGDEPHAGAYQCK